MTTEDKTWESLVADYLRQVEKSLAAVGYSSRKDIIEDVRTHLAQRYADLPSEKHNWDSYQETITEMGPPSDYAELLGMAVLRRRVITWRRVAICLPLVLLLLAVGVYRGIIPSGFYDGPRIYSIPSEKLPGAIPQWDFVSDPQLIGQWKSVDFVRSPVNFSPQIKTWSGDLLVTGLDFHGDGFISLDTEEISAIKWSEYVWTKNWIQNRENTLRAEYHIEQLQDETYLFFPWLSGDVTIRNMGPWYYVLKKLETGEGEP